MTTRNFGTPPPAPGTPIGQQFFACDPRTLARRTLGTRLVRILDDGTRLSGLIVETEAYLGVGDRAAHSFGGRRTPRNESMYGPAGTAYVYFTYGMHHCFNIVCGEENEPVAVLIRALEPTEGLEAMFARRPRASESRHLCSGPGKVCQAMAIDRSLDGLDLVTDARLFLERGPNTPITSGVVNSARIGLGDVGRWKARRLRWHLRGCPHVSRP